MDTVFALEKFDESHPMYYTCTSKLKDKPAQLHKSVALQSYYPKIIVVLCIKNVRFCTPRSCALNPFNFEFRDSA